MKAEAHIFGLEGGFMLEPSVTLGDREVLAITYESGTPTRYDVVIDWNEKKVVRSGVCVPRADHQPGVGNES